ncbi:MAG: hypothetical protein HY438_00715 [DPANN group archaeon]|nr:hypothetical protein [DPANN group archaeon]
MAKIRIYFIESLKEKLTKTQKSELRKIILQNAKKACKIFGVPLVSFIVRQDKKLVIPETGESAITLTEDQIGIYVDVRRIKQLRARLPQTIYHELNHAARGHNALHSKSTLLQAIIAEGLAIAVEEEFFNNIPPYGKYTKKEVEKYLKILNKNLHVKKYDYYEWFHGAGKLPRWLGYKVGAYIVKQAKANTGLTTVKLTRVPAEKIFEMGQKNNS